MYTERLKNGKVRYIQTYKDPVTGKNKKVYCTFEKESKTNTFAAAQILQEKIDEKSADFLQSGDIRLTALISKCIEYKKTNLKDSSFKTQASTLNQLPAVLGDIKIKNLNARYISSKLLESGKDISTLNMYIKYIKILMRWAHKNDFIESYEQFQKLEKFKDTTRKPRNIEKYMEKDELNVLLGSIEESIYRYLIEFLVLTGLRIGEALVLKLDDLDLSNRLIRINKTFEINVRQVGTTKTLTSDRELYIQDELLQFLKKFKKYRLEDMFRKGIKTDRLFYSKKGKILGYDNFARYFSNKTEELLGRHLSPHSLRHTHASLMFEQGVSLEAISQRLGHSESKITKEIYLHITERKKEAYRLEVNKKIL